MEKSIPHHISKIINELNEENNKEEVLIRYSFLLCKDVSLMQIYLELGFCLKSNSFTRPVNTSQVLSVFNQEYGIQQHNIDNYLANAPVSADNDSEMRQELLRFFYDQGINEIASSVDLGLEIPEDNTLTAMWQDYTPQSKSQQFSTPKPKKFHKTPSTQATIYLTPSPLNTPYSEESEMETPRSARGLKHLTTLVKHLVCKHQPTSFKNVAVKLIDELIVTDGPDRVKEEKNVRRRVYDAINVLIAAEVLERNGRNVSWKEKWDSVEIDMRKNETEKRRKRVEEKKKDLQIVLNKYLAIKHLINRNSRGLNYKPAISFPFIVVSTPDIPKNSMSIKVNSNATSLHLKLAKPISLFGDMDILLSLSLHKLSLSSLLQYLPSKDLLNYCSIQDY
ncbi:hypothetical protein SteCoe_28380 [Stentor coeruleus]|uniref:E2F/DP family winged-helix DNA-binding domain-containing protein n=1 Tax=Stentor coeruleus TaxID=5963 RepID=A0A1R2B8B8_9CILI|nr:hypothetical protein SteCoe_28380 [Stentor coeruleus]